jgi:Flp pilus assembly protein TadG
MRRLTSSAETMARILISRLRRLRIVRHEGGLAAVEFALILPILVVLWFGGVELTQGLSVDRHVNNLASSVGDLVSRTKVLTAANIDQILDIAPGAMYPYCKTEAACTTAGLKMRVSAVNMDAGGTATIAWSRGQDITAYADNLNMNSTVPAALRVANTQIIMAEVYYTYTPSIGYVVTGNVALEDRMFFVPRLVTKIQLCTSNPPPTGCKGG